jgi:hypothetical protein
MVWRVAQYRGDGGSGEPLSMGLASGRGLTGAAGSDNGEPQAGGYGPGVVRAAPIRGSGAPMTA